MAMSDESKIAISLINSSPSRPPSFMPSFYCHPRQAKCERGSRVTNSGDGTCIPRSPVKPGMTNRIRETGHDSAKQDQTCQNLSKRVNTCQNMAEKEQNMPIDAKTGAKRASTSQYKLLRNINLSSRTHVRDLKKSLSYFFFGITKKLTRKLTHLTRFARALCTLILLMFESQWC